MVVFTGPTGAGKTTLVERALGQLSEPRPRFVGDVRSPEDVESAVTAAAHSSIVAVARSGQSSGLRRRWAEMGLHERQLNDANIVVVTQRLIPRGDRLPSVLVVEVLNPDGSFASASLADEARQLVRLKTLTEAQARMFIPFD